MSAWLVYALLSAIFAALVGIFAKIGLTNIDSNTATAIRAIIMAIFLIIVVFLQNKQHALITILQDKKTFLFIVLSGIAGALSWLFYFLAIQLGPVSKVAPIDKLSVVFTVVFALIFLGEKMSLLGLLGVGLIAGGSLLIMWAK